MSTVDDFEFKSFGYKLKQTQHSLRVHMDDVLRPLGLTTPQYAALSIIKLKPGISNAALARASFVTAQTMHGIISILEKDNLIQRKGDPKNNRILRSELTKQGQKVLKKAQAIIDDVEKIMTHTMTQTDKSYLKKLLEECINNLKKLDEQ